MDTTQHYFKQKNLPELIEQAASLLTLEFSQFKEVFSKYPISITERYEEELMEREIRIQLLDKESTIRCFFNDSKLCHLVYLYPNKPEELLCVYVSYLNDMYPYESLGYGWRLPQCYLTFTWTEDGFSFLIGR